jgi:hypothetical protein
MLVFGLKFPSSFQGNKSSEKIKTNKENTKIIKLNKKHKNLT